MQSKYTKILVDNIETWRIKHHLSQADFAKKIGLSPSTYSKLITGDISKITADTIVRLYELTGSLCYQLMEYHDGPYLEIGYELLTMTEKEQAFILHMIRSYKEAKYDFR